MLQKRTLEYTVDSVRCRSDCTWRDDGTKQRPAILVAPTWSGLNTFAKERAEMMAASGCIGVVVDLYGEGKVAESDKEAEELMVPLFMDRQLLRRRMQAAVTAVKKLPEYRAGAIGVMGFCFGGLAAIELLRGGDEDIKGTVTFHSVLGDTYAGKKAQTAPIADNITSSLLLLHGYEDPLVSPEDLKALQDEMTAAKVDWVLHCYGHTSHAFTNPQADRKGFTYHKKSAKRAWRSMCRFFNDVFGEEFDIGTFE